MNNLKDTSISNYSIKVPIQYLIFIICLYIFSYGTVSIFLNNTFFRITKDIIILILALYSVFKIKYYTNKIFSLIIFNLLFLSIFGMLGSVLTGDWLTFVYGYKITLLPIFMLLFGVILSKKYDITIFDKIYVFIFFISFGIWVYQYSIGIQRLLDIGFVYGTNVKTFASELRLPSIMGTPDGYAFSIAILGIIFVNGKLFSQSRLLRWILKILITIVLVLSTIRNALLFWLISEAILYILTLNKVKSKKFYLLVSLISIFIGTISLSVYYYIFYSSRSINLFDIGSIVDRFSHWGNNLPDMWSIEGLVGYGLGAIGAASRRTADLGYDSINYSVDNQYIAIYGQLGLIGSLVFFVLFILIFVQLLNAIRYNHYNAKRALSVYISALIVAIFSNVMEAFPFNILFWFFLGTCIADKNSKEIEKRN